MNARDLRKKQTLAEQMIWDAVRNRRLGGYKIRRQQILNDFIIDFYCAEKKLCIEVDGPYHNEPIVKGLDRERDEELEFEGYTVIRFTNDEVMHELDVVLASILTTLNGLPANGCNPLNHRPRPNFDVFVQGRPPLARPQGAGSEET
jgi:very-short-patch-repair endonuclease